ncbi:HNH endonuclease signature motif containing protein [Microbacterium sp. CH12i]|uniref:HNH endonuclease signature motif containing protein n=1 Tax=Microbacterium sp. CH12i TaxID=1479651 RepID=UPI0005613C74|nr:HNH endonuclease signature motif containing protein [Microbacterium sp. CH12i]
MTAAQFDAIRRGLGEAPEIDTDHADAAACAQARAEARAAWAQAAEHLINEAAERTVEELWQQARSIRDLLDPEGAEARFLARFENRSFRTYRGQDGQKRASLVLDDEGDLFIETLLAAALRPRRGGPRFVDADEKEQAASLADDPRTNDQLAYDLIMDVLRAGSLADAESVFGTRQAGVRLVQVVDADGNGAPVAHSEDHLMSMPGSAADQRICESGFVTVTIDSHGNPLNLGREQRLFTSKQRIALAIRDGGCRWRGCDRPASYCEAHHIDPYSAGGRTDIDRGILLCRYHHMTLHHGRWRITRRGKDDFVLQHPSGEMFAMRSRMVLSYAFGGIDPPPKRFRPAA